MMLGLVLRHMRIDAHAADRVYGKMRTGGSRGVVTVVGMVVMVVIVGMSHRVLMENWTSDDTWHKPSHHWKVKGLLEEAMNIGEAAAASGVTAKMIRYYEEIDLLPRVQRTASGYREYSETDVHRLRFVRRARDFGFSMKQISGLLVLWADRSRPSREVKEIALAHVAELEEKIRHLTEMRDVLQHLAHQCHGDHRPDCPILQDLGGPPEDCCK
jgi:Cu(I)-responsive transcriptional regulator